MRLFVRSFSSSQKSQFSFLKFPFSKIDVRSSSASTSISESISDRKPTNLRKVLKVAIIGVPNAGKSTFINQIVGRSIFAMSRKVHTTRCKARAVMNVGSTQLIFLDTPGVVSVKESVKHHLERSCLVDSEDALKEADVVGILHDASNEYTKFKLDPKILRLLYLYPEKHTFLVLNKIDAMKNRLDLLDCARILTKKDEKHESRIKPITRQGFTEIELNEIVSSEVGWPHFEEVFMVSALTGSGVGDIQIYLTDLARPGEWIFPENVITDQKKIKIIEDTVFSKLQDNLQKNIPYELKIEVENFDISEDGSVTTFVNIGAKNDKIMGYLIGQRGTKIRKIAEAVEQNLKQFFLNDVRVRLTPVKMNKIKTPNEDEKQKLMSESL